MILEPFVDWIFTFNVFVIIVNVLLFFFAKRIIAFLDTTDLEKKKTNGTEEANIKKKIQFLHFLNVVIFISYFATFFAKIDFINDLIRTLFVIMVIYITNAWLLRRIIIFYWEEIEINWNTYLKKWYKTNLFSLLVSIFSIILAVFLSFQLLWFDGIFQTWWAIAWILAFVGFTAPVWAPDMVAWIIMLHNNRVWYWDVIKIDELWILAWVKTISLSEVKLIDLRYSHPILLRPSKLREVKIENLSRWINWKKLDLTQSIDIKIWYDVDFDNVKNLCFDAFDEMILDLSENGNRKYFTEKPFRDIEIVEFWDNAILYKFSYYISSPFYIIKAERLLNEYLLKHQNINKISFSTPVLEMSVKS